MRLMASKKKHQHFVVLTSLELVTKTQQDRGPDLLYCYRKLTQRNQV